MAAPQMLTTLMFVPAHDARKVAKAQTSAADAIILDLEDAVPEQTKGEARAAAARLVREHQGVGPRVWVRINGAQTPHYDADLRAIDWSRAGLLVPKAEEPAAVRAFASLTLSGLILTLETAAGCARAADLAAAAPIESRFALGTWDLALDLGLAVDDPDESELVWHVRAQTVLASRAAGLQPPIDGVYGRIDDDAGLERMATRAFHLGFGGKLLVHPRQIPVTAKIFGRDEVRLRDAQALIEAYEAAAQTGTGAIRHNGQMIDRVHVDLARRLVARWSR